MKILKLFLLFIIIFLLINANEKKEIAFVMKVKGKMVNYRHEKWNTLKKGDILYSGDIVRCDENSLGIIKFVDNNAIIKLRAKTELEISAEKDAKKLKKKIKLVTGALFAKVNSGDLVIEGKDAVASVKGTQFYSFMENDTFRIVCTEGTVILENSKGKIEINEGETGEITGDIDPYKILTEEIPNWGDEAKGIEETIEIEFEDSDGNTKTLEIELK